MEELDDPILWIQRELIPLLEELVNLCNDEGECQQSVFFDTIRESLTEASNEDDLAEPFMQLSITAIVGFDYSPAAVALLDKILNLARNLALRLSSAEWDAP